MGINKLWDMLEQTRMKKSLKEFRGETLSVDFSCWFVECHSARNEYPNRSILYRILDLMSKGITPVIVFDSATNLKLKLRKRGPRFYKSTLLWEELLMTMGFPVIRASGEAEKVCAQLNSVGSVSACMTNDGDSLAYGATTVLKGYSVKDSKRISVYEISRIIECPELRLGQEEIIAAAMLIGSDYYKGVESVGQKYFLKFVHELKKRDVTGVLKRMLSWEENGELLSIVDDKKKLDGMRKPKHCTKCSHLGSVTTHEKRGCQLCGTNCADGSNSSVHPCSCEYHLIERKIEAFSSEIKVRELALKDGKFLSTLKIVSSEFKTKSEEDYSGDIALIMRKPDFPKVVELLTELSVGRKAIKHIIPALVKMAFYGKVQDLEIVPLTVINECKEDREPCFTVKFQKLELDTITHKEEYEIKVLQSKFDEKFPDFEPKDE